MQTSRFQYGHKPEVWGGIECTINRVGDSYYDQLEKSGHYYRDMDIKDIAQLGITSLRYPVLWERHCKNEEDIIDWDWTEQKLNEIKAYNIKPVVGLLHHGSGPAFTNLEDPLF